MWNLANAGAAGPLWWVWILRTLASLEASTRQITLFSSIWCLDWVSEISAEAQWASPGDPLWLLQVLIYAPKIYCADMSMQTKPVHNTLGFVKSAQCKQEMGGPPLPLDTKPQNSQRSSLEGAFILWLKTMPLCCLGRLLDSTTRSVILPMTLCIGDSSSAVTHKGYLTHKGYSSFWSTP